jgi:cell division protein DivIC
MMKKILHTIYPVLKNKYLLSLSFFLLWILFFDQNNLLDRYKLVREVHQLQKDRLYYIERIRSDSARLDELMTGSENLEKFAREQYLMKKDNEDIFVITDH